MKSGRKADGLQPIASCLLGDVAATLTGTILSQIRLASCLLGDVAATLTGTILSQIRLSLVQYFTDLNNNS